MRRLISFILILLLTIPCSAQEKEPLTLPQGIHMSMGYVYACIMENKDLLPKPKRELQLEGVPIPQIFISKENICPSNEDNNPIDNKIILACTIFNDDIAPEEVGMALQLTDNTSIILGYGTEEKKYPNSDQVFIALIVLKYPFTLSTLMHEMVHYLHAYYFGIIDAEHESPLWDACGIVK